MSYETLRYTGYSALLAAALGVLAFSVSVRESATAWAERNQEPSFVELPDGRVSAVARLDLDNAGDVDRRYHLYLVESPGASLRSQHLWTLAPRKSQRISIYIDAPRESFVAGKRRVYLRIHESGGAERIVALTLRGPTA